MADVGWRARIANSLRVSAENVWLEIGAGHGEMTVELARRAGRVIAIEVDPHLVERLRQLARELHNVEVVAGDVLELDLGRLAGSRPFKVFGNLPYYITSPILHRLFEQGDALEAIHVVVQLEVAARLAARPGRRQYGYLSVLAQFYARPEIVLRIPPGAFRPRPQVTSALVSLLLPGERARLSLADEGEFLEFAKACFERKRKTLLNNLRPLLGNEQAQQALCAAGLRVDTRAEQLSVTQFAELYRRQLSLSHSAEGEKDYSRSAAIKRSG